MTLTEKEYKEFLGTHLKFLFFVGRQQNITGDISFADFLKLGKDIKFKCRRAVINDINLLDQYIQQHFDDLTALDLEILSEFRNQKTGRFIIFKCLSKYAVFIDTSDNSFYAVSALGDRFDEFFDAFPVIISTSILPFKGKIIYDGFIELPVMYVGANMTRALKVDYKKAQAQNKIRRTITDEQTSY